jgi:predicted nucleic acid-binding protein
VIRTLLDTDVILDLVLAREPFVDDAAALWLAHEERRCVAYIAPITPINVFYIVRKIKGAAVAREAVNILITTLQVGIVDQQVLRAALNMPMKDYEDAVQVASAAALQLDSIVTRNTGDYANAALQIFSPTDFLKQLPTT